MFHVFSSLRCFANECQSSALLLGLLQILNIESAEELRMHIKAPRPNLLLGFLQILYIECAEAPYCGNPKLNAYLQPYWFRCELNTLSQLISTTSEEIYGELAGVAIKHGLSGKYKFKIQISSLVVKFKLKIRKERVHCIMAVLYTFAFLQSASGSDTRGSANSYTQQGFFHCCRIKFLFIYNRSFF